MATQFVLDLFTEAADTLLSAHTPDVGGAWVEHPSYISDVTVLAEEDRVSGSSTSASVYLNTAVPANADYEVRAIVRLTSHAARVGIAARFSDTDNTGYYFFWNTTTFCWEVRRVVAGSLLVLASFNTAPALSTDIALRLALYQSRIVAYLDGSVLFDFLDPSPILSVGYSGLVTNSDSRVDGFEAYTLDNTNPRVSQALIEAISVGEFPSPRIAQKSIEVASQYVFSSPLLSQSVVEVASAVVTPMYAAQYVVEVVSRKYTFDGEAKIESLGSADLRQGLPLEIEIEIDFIGVAQLDIGSTLYLGSPPHVVVAELEGRVQARAALAGEAQADISGVADFNYGTEIRPIINNLSLRVVGSLRVGVQADNLSNFFLVF